MLTALLCAGGACAQTLVDAPGRDRVQAHCGGCHSLALVAQNRGDRAHWLGLVRWMQDKHGLWPLGDDEISILDYLETHYGAPENTPRRRPLTTEWRTAEYGD